jgi:hypothetical protein
MDTSYAVGAVRPPTEAQPKVERLNHAVPYLDCVTESFHLSYLMLGAENRFDDPEGDES